MIIHADNYFLRNIEIDDAEEFFNMTHDDEDVKKYVPSSYPTDMEDAYELIEIYSKSNFVNEFYFAIESFGKMVGVLVASKLRLQILEVSAIIFKPYRNKGIMTVVLKTFKEWLKNNTDYRVLNLVIRKDNLASLQQAKKCGAVLHNEDEEHCFFKIYLK